MRGGGGGGGERSGTARGAKEGEKGEGGTETDRQGRLELEEIAEKPGRGESKGGTGEGKEGRGGRSGENGSGREEEGRESGGRVVEAALEEGSDAWDEEEKKLGVKEVRGRGRLSRWCEEESRAEANVKVRHPGGVEREEEEETDLVEAPCDEDRSRLFVFVADVSGSAVEDDAGAHWSCSWAAGPWACMEEAEEQRRRPGSWMVEDAIREDSTSKSVALRCDESA